jgi:hypothetical protein
MRETRLSGSVEGVVSNHDPYSDLVSRLASIVRLVEKTTSMDVRPRLDHKIFPRTLRFWGPCRCTFPVRVHVIAAERWLSRKK